MLTQVISNQTSSLQNLDLYNNSFSSVSTEKLLTRIAECSVCSTLQELNLNGSANFDSDKTVRKFADILATAPDLKKCSISYQEGNRKVKITVEYATEERMGAIVITDRNNKEIHRRETDKQEAHHNMQIYY